VAGTAFMKMKKIFSILFLGLLVCCAQKAQSANLYSRQTTFPPLKLSQEDLKALISNIEIYVAKANSESVTTVVHQVEISDNEKTITYKGPAASLPFERLPEICYKLTYLYYLPYSEDSSVSQIQMNFDDYSRTLTVQGSQPEQVDGLFLLIQDDISKHISRFGGSGFRQSLVMLIYLFLIGMFFLFYYLHNNGWYIAFGIICGATVLLVGFFLLLQKILPGFALISGEVSWIRRYSAEIGFYGLIITLLVAIIPFLKTNKKRPKKNL
jgi:hypothetical protein